MTEGDRHLDFRDNNFDLVRLFAAFQVALNHSIKHLKVGDGVFVAVNDLLKLFPGVPIFFFVRKYFKLDRLENCNLSLSSTIR